MASLSRRAAIGAFTAMASSPVLFASSSAAATLDPAWCALVADYRAKRAAWLDTISLEDDLADDVAAALAALPPKPIQPPAQHVDFSELTLREWMATEQTPEREEAWASHKRDMEAWKARRDETEARILAPAKERYRLAWNAYAAALDTLAEHPVGHLLSLAEKIEIIVADYEGESIPPEYLSDVVTDVRRLAGAA